MNVDEITRWLLKMKILGAKDIRINKNILEVYNSNNEKIGSKKIIKEV